jgi:cytochrome c oxidase subunit 2
MSLDGPGDERDPAVRTRRSPVLAVLYGIVGGVLVAVPTIWVATLDSNFGMPEAATSEGDDIVLVWRILMAMATAVAMVVAILLAVALFTGARRREPSQSKGSVPLELTYTAVPVLLVAAIFGVSVWLSERISDETDDATLVVEVEAFRWGWRFTYPNGHEIVGVREDEPTLVLPVDRTTSLALRSDDVIHSFFVPSFATKLDVVPGRDNELSVHPTDIGEYRGHCAEFCGLDHARMNFVVAIVEADAFDAWLEDPTEDPP